MDAPKMGGDEYNSVPNHPQLPEEESEQSTALNHSQHAYEISEQDFNELVAYFSEEAYFIDINDDRLNTMCDEFLRFATGTYYTRIETRVGWLYIAYSGHKLQFVSLEEKAIFLDKAENRLGTQPIPDEESHLPEDLIERVKAAVESHTVYDEPIDLSHLSDFEKLVLKHVRYILPGEVCSYETLAQVIDQPEAIDEIARVIANNPFPAVIPCHRMVKSDGYLDDYCSGGIETKKRLLGLEGVEIRGDYAIKQEELEKVKVAEKEISQLSPEQLKTLHAYLTWLIDRYQYIRTNEAFPGVNFVDFLEIYTPQQLLVSATSTSMQTSEGQGSMPWLEEAEECRQENQWEIQDIIQQQKHVVILGEPGSGKTTILRHLALKYAKSMQAYLHSGYKGGPQLLPIPLQLVDYVQSGMLVGDPLRDFLVDYFAYYGCQTAGLAELLATAFDAGWCLVLLDGLDEIGTMQQQIKLVRHLNHFVGHYSPPNNHFVITSRITGYYQYLANPFVYCTIRGMNYDMVNAFLGKWVTMIENANKLSIPSASSSLSVRHGRERHLLKTTLQRIVRITHARITYRSDDSCQSQRSITPLLAQVVVIIYYTLIHLKSLCAELAQWMLELMDESDLYHNRQHSYSARDYLVSLFSEEIYKHYLDRHSKNYNKAPGNMQNGKQEVVERCDIDSINDEQNTTIMQRSIEKESPQEPPSTAVEDIIHFIFKNPDKKKLDKDTEMKVEHLYNKICSKADDFVAQSRGILEKIR
jgi:O-6-methylguanine DNA methyltransferase